MYESIESELFASIATLDQLKKMYDLGAVEIRSYQRESEALVYEVKSQIEELRRMGLDIASFLDNERITENFPDASSLLSLFERRPQSALNGLTLDEYFDQLGLAILDVATIHASKGLMGLAELIVEVVKRVPQFKSVSYNDVIEAVNRVSEHGLIPGIRNLRGGVKVVELRPLELRRDQADVVNLAAVKGYTSVEEIMMELKWSEEHARQVLSSLVEVGMAVADIRFSTGGRYYFPGLRSRNSQDSDMPPSNDRRYSDSS
ncbi:MAG: hypothetical protein P1Q69_10300 [Candidatus Thorarchaeota archaeon]|nr:hypothetical protein [Candidatus Thorarchaeota archaeon]